MSKIFYDDEVALEKVEKEINSLAKTPEEKEEMWGIVDGIVHHHIMGSILEQLHKDHHKDFLKRYQKAPHDTKLLAFLTKRIGKDIKQLLKYEAESLTAILLQEIRGK